MDGTLVAAHFSDPWEVKGDGHGHLYVADRNMIRTVDLAAGTVTTTVGTYGTVGSADGQGSQASFNLVSGVALVGTQLFLTDTENYTIRVVDLVSGTVSTVAGATHVRGATDGPAAQARFQEPEGIAADAAGKLYIADTDNNTIRALDPTTGTVTTIAGSPGVSGSSDGVGAAASFYKPRAMSFDAAGNLYVIDALNQSIRKVVVATGAVSTLVSFVSTGAVPQGIAVDGADVLVSLGDPDNRVVRVSPDGTVATLAGSQGVHGFVDGPGSAALFYSPAGLFNDGAGTLYVGDDGNAVVRAIALAGPTVSTVAGVNSLGSRDGTSTAARFAAPQGLATDGVVAYVADTGNDAIRRIDLASGAVTTPAGVAGQPGRADGAPSDARFSRPEGVALDAVGNILYVADTGNHALRRIDWKAATVKTLTLTSAADASFPGLDAPTGLALDHGRLYVTDYTDEVVVSVDLQTSQVSILAGTYGSRGETDGVGPAARFYGPMGIAADGLGHLYVADNLGQTVRRIDTATAAVTTEAGKAYALGSTDGIGTAVLFYYPVGVAANTLGDVFVSDSANNLVRRLDALRGAVVTVIGTLAAPGVKPGALPAQLTLPSALALTPSGDLLLVSENSVLIAH